MSRKIKALVFCDFGKKGKQKIAPFFKDIFKAVDVEPTFLDQVYPDRTPSETSREALKNPLYNIVVTIFIEKDGGKTSERVLEEFASAYQQRKIIGAFLDSNINATTKALIREKAKGTLPFTPTPTGLNSIFRVAQEYIKKLVEDFKNMEREKINKELQEKGYKYSRVHLLKIVRFNGHGVESCICKTKIAPDHFKGITHRFALINKPLGKDKGFKSLKTMEKNFLNRFDKQSFYYRVLNTDTKTRIKYIEDAVNNPSLEKKIKFIFEGVPKPKEVKFGFGWSYPKMYPATLQEFKKWKKKYKQDLLEWKYNLTSQVDKFIMEIKFEHGFPIINSQTGVFIEERDLLDNNLINKRDLPPYIDLHYTTYRFETMPTSSPQTFNIKWGLAK